MSDLSLIDILRRRIRALPPLWVDGALTAAILIAQIWPLLSTDGETGEPWDWWGYVVVIAASLPLVWRRRAPITVLIICLCTGTLYDLADHVARQPIWYGGLVALYTVAAYSGAWQRITVFAMSIIGGITVVGSLETALRGTVLFVAAYAIGRATATSRAHAAALEERAERLERERQVEAERAAEHERARIARDMHDILAHAVSLMVVQAEAGPVVVRSNPARAEAAFDAIAAAGRDAMMQLRRMLGVLKDEEAPRAPQPTIDDLPALADQVSHAGLRVAFASTGRPRPLSPDCAVAAYRVTQEALTNIVKHAGANHADIRLTWEDDTLTLDITDDGRGRATDGPGLPSGGHGLLSGGHELPSGGHGLLSGGHELPSGGHGLLSGGHGLPSGGHGLIGIRERAAACGGTAAAGHRTDGPGFHVSVRLPLAQA